MTVAPDVETRYTKAGEVHIAYSVVGQGEFDLVLVLGFASHLDMHWQLRQMSHFLRSLGSFSRLIVFDKRGTGLSDRSVGVPSLEERMDDIRAVMDAVGSERAVLLGISEGAPTCLLFAATYPERTSSLVLVGGMARSTYAPDYPWAAPVPDLVRATEEMIAPDFYTGEDIQYWAPSMEDDGPVKEWLGRYRRSSVSPDGMYAIFKMFLDIDVRPVLPTLRVPTLVLHRRGDRVVNRRAGEWIATQIRGARYVELPGQDHFPWFGDTDGLVDEIREFLTGVRIGPVPDRVLATVLFTDIVGSTERALALGDHRWRQLLDDHYDTAGTIVEQHRGREIKTTGDGLVACFDGPARAIAAAQRMRDSAHELDVQIRCGLHTGEIELRGDDITGIAVVLAQRVSALAQADDVLVSSTVKDLVAGSGIEFEPHGQHELKGVPGEWSVFRVRS